jgi:GAF domain-containing protein
VEQGYDALTRVMGAYIEATGLDSFLERLVQLAADVVIPPAATGITLVRDGDAVTVVTSDEAADQVDRLQYDAGEGPCLEAMATRTLVEVHDLRQETRWPRWTDPALDVGVRAALASPLQVAGQTFGALNLYAFAPEVFTRTEVRRVEIFAAQAAGALQVMRREIAKEEAIRDLEAALESRGRIDQAIGVVMAQQRCGPEEALTLLRMHSSNTNRKLRDVAAELVARFASDAASAAAADDHTFRPRRHHGGSAGG